VVLVSLARAGTPVGVLIRRWLAHRHGLTPDHYAASIVRGRGIDEVALGYLAARYDPRQVIFVDGWTGKGAIAKELAAAVTRVNLELGLPEGAGFSPELAVLADPGACVRIYGTRDDFLIPSACLNSTVSGLVSRTVLNREILAPEQFHGAKFYAELAGVDRSNEFLDAVSAEFAAIEGLMPPVPDVAAPERVPDWAGWSAVAEIGRRYQVRDLNLIKPGVGETTRVLLRRVPWRILVNPAAEADLAHIRLLAGQRATPIEEVADLPYSCVGLIHPDFNRAPDAGLAPPSAAAISVVSAEPEPAR
jgi:hypothetical protein